MKNHHRTEKEVRGNRSGHTAQTKNGTPASNYNPLVNGTTAESAKSTLATKLLQKEKDRQQAVLHYSNLANGTNPNTGSLQIIAVSNDSPGQNLDMHAKSYAMLTSPIAPEDYEHYKRISVIQTPAANSVTAAVGANFFSPTLSLEVNASHANPASHMQVQFYNANTAGSNNDQIQDQPVDFSPKNNFTHSAKTSPFELTGNYAILA